MKDKLVGHIVHALLERDVDAVAAPAPRPRLASARVRPCRLARPARRSWEPTACPAFCSQVQSLIEEYAASESPDYINWGVGADVPPAAGPPERMPGGSALLDGAAY